MAWTYIKTSFGQQQFKECNQNLKWILNQCVHSHVRFCKNSPVTRLYYRVQRKKGKNKATVAAARKLLTCIWHMLMKGEEFKLRPLKNLHWSQQRTQDALIIYA